MRPLSNHPSISAVIITKNEQDVIAGSLKSLFWVDEIILVDDFSDDNTVKIAKKYTKNVFLHKLQTLGKQKQYALNKATCNWIIMLDADERIPANLSREIINAIKKSDYSAYNVYFHQFFLGKPLTPTLSGGHPRIFKRGVGRVTPAAVHERIIINGKIGQLKTPIIHLSHRSISGLIYKFNKYTDDQAKIMYLKGSRAGILTIPGSMIYNFWIRQKEFKDYKSGVRGFVLTSIFLIYHFLKWVKIWELQALAKDSKKKG